MNRTTRLLSAALLPAVLMSVPALAPTDLRAGDPASSTNIPSTHLPRIVLKPGELYFRVADQPAFLFGRNPTGPRVEHFDDPLASVAAAGERIVRLHLTPGFRTRRVLGQVDEPWARSWERVFDLAAAKGLFVLPVFDVWADWNDGSRGELWHRWDRNLFNAANGGPAATPAELFQDSACQRLWLQELGMLIRRWQTRSNLIGWEIFSELDLVTGATEAAALPLVERAAQVIRAADRQRRPVTASLSGIRDWPALSRSTALDLLQVHPYANGRFGGRLDDLILSSVRERLRQYGKPVFIGECGLDSRGLRGSLIDSPRASVGIRHAIWATAVSGAMNGRMLWWEDGYDRYPGLELSAKYASASTIAVRFVQGVDFTNFRPVAATHSNELKGATMGNSQVVLGWFRDAHCEPPEWPVRRVPSQIVKLDVPGSSGRWRVEFFDPITGVSTEGKTAQRVGKELRVMLSAFEDALAFKLTLQP